MIRQFKIIIEKHSDGYVAYPPGLKGVGAGDGDSYEEALTDVKSAIAFHIETFGEHVLERETPAFCSAPLLVAPWRSARSACAERSG